jgi:hypothetical protein
MPLMLTIRQMSHQVPFQIPVGFHSILATVLIRQQTLVNVQGIAGCMGSTLSETLVLLTREEDERGKGGGEPSS